MTDQLDQFLNEQLSKNKEVDRALGRLNSFETRGTFYGCRGTRAAFAAASGAWYSLAMVRSWDYSPGDWTGGMIPISLVLTGTIQYVNGSTNLAGVGTLFLTELYPGAAIYGNAGANIGVVASVQSNTQATMFFPWLAAWGPGAGGRWDALMAFPSTGIWQCTMWVTKDAPATVGRIMGQFVFGRAISEVGLDSHPAGYWAYPTYSCNAYIEKGDYMNPQILQTNAGAAAVNVTGVVTAVKIS